MKGTKLGALDGRVRTCTRYRYVRGGKLRCAHFEPADAVGKNPCSPPELVDGPLGKSAGLVREEEILCAGPTIKPLLALPGARAGRLHQQPTDLDDPRLLGHGRRAPRRRHRGGIRGRRSITNWKGEDT